MHTLRHFPDIFNSNRKKRRETHGLLITKIDGFVEQLLRSLDLASHNRDEQNRPQHTRRALARSSFGREHKSRLTEDAAAKNSSSLSYRETLTGNGTDLEFYTKEKTILLRLRTERLHGIQSVKITLIFNDTELHLHESDISFDHVTDEASLTNTAAMLAGYIQQFLTPDQQHYL